MSDCRKPRSIGGKPLLASVMLAVEPACIILTALIKIGKEMVEVFKTNVRKKTESKRLLRILSDAFPSFKMNFDLSDCDKVLRIEGENIKSIRIMILLKEHGFNCEILN